MNENIFNSQIVYNLRMSYAIINSHIITMDGENLGIIENGGVGFRDNTIDYVGPISGFDYQSYEFIVEGKNQISMPGLINTHFHSSSTLLRGGAQDVPEIEWMNKAIGPLAQSLTTEDRILGSQIGVLEGIRSGTTTFAENTRDVDSIIDKSHLKFGSRVVAAETINEISSNRVNLHPRDLYEYDKEKGEGELKTCEALFNKYQGNELISCMYGPQALDMVSLDLLSTIYERAREQEAMIHMHVAQGGRERIQIEERYGSGASTVSVLNNNNMLNKRLLAAHIHDTTNEERKLMVQNDVKMASCQSSIAMIDGLVSPVSDYINMGGIAGLGTDQAPGPGNHNMIREMRTASLLAKVTSKDPTALPGWEALRLGTINGAAALGIDKEVGSLQIGKKADIIMIDMNRLNMIPFVTKPFRTFVPNLVYSANGSEVSNVFINGKQILSDGQFLDVDVEKLKEEALDRANIIFQQASEEWRIAGSKLVSMVENGFL